MRVQELDFLVRMVLAIRERLGNKPIENVFFVGGDKQGIFFANRNIVFEPFSRNGWVIGVGYDEPTGSLFLQYPETRKT